MLSLTLDACSRSTHRHRCLYRLLGGRGDGILAGVLPSRTLGLRNYSFPHPLHRFEAQRRPTQVIDWHSVHTANSCSCQFTHAIAAGSHTAMASARTAATVGRRWLSPRPTSRPAYSTTGCAVLCCSRAGLLRVHSVIADATLKLGAMGRVWTYSRVDDLGQRVNGLGRSCELEECALLTGSSCCSWHNRTVRSQLPLADVLQEFTAAGGEVEG